MYWIFQAFGAAYDPMAARVLQLRGMLAKVTPTERGSDCTLSPLM